LTYIRLKTRFVFLAVLLDAWSRKVVGYAISHLLDARLPLAAPEAALTHRRPGPGLVHHSDRGGQPGFK
jgi:putative transposase